MTAEKNAPLPKSKPASRQRRKDPSAGGKRSGMAEDGPVYHAGPKSEPDFELAAEEMAEGPASSLERGIEVLKKALTTLPMGPGVYRMINQKGDVLYVGKARSLKKRVTNYTQVAKLPRRLQRMVAETIQLEVVTTHTEVEALLLESNMIKRFMPRYNVLLRDDKSFPYILLTSQDEVPRVTKHRGAQSKPGDYFGPFASAGAVNRAVTALEKAFLLRSCSDAVYDARTRPCLMYQIKRCSAPCVGRIDKAGYADLVAQAKDFLTGRSQQVQEDLAQQMEEASARLDFETAARFRDRIRAMAHIQAHQDINVEGVENADVIAATQEAGQTCIQVFFFRAGRNYGNRAYFPKHDKDQETREVLSSFVAQFYDNKPVPKEVLVSESLDDQALIAEALENRAKRRVQLKHPTRGPRRKLVELALANARDALARRLAESSTQRQLLEGLAETMLLENAPERIEVYDNSHIQGSNPYGAMIVAGPEGLMKQAYRKFAIRGVKEGKFAAGDDYAMMREVLTRRFTRALKEDPDREGGQWPDLVLLDGGKGQLSAAEEVFAELGLEDVPVAAIAKGPDRDAGRERIFLPGKEGFLLQPRDPVLYFIQRLRDEAHRFAIGSHRAGRSKSRLTSPLDEIKGIGAKRKKALLLHFGSAKAVSRAGLSDLEAVEGVSKQVAKKIYEHFHSGT